MTVFVLGSTRVHQERAASLRAEQRLAPGAQPPAPNHLTTIEPYLVLVLVIDLRMIFGASISKWLVLAALVVLLWVARGVLPPFIVAGILAYVLSPLVDELAVRSGVRRAWVALGVFCVFFAVLAGLVWFAGARLSTEVRDISREGPSIIESVVDKLTGGQNLDMFGQSITSRELGRRLDVALRDELGTPSQAIQAVRVGFELTLDIVLVFLGLVYMLIDGHNFLPLLAAFRAARASSPCAEAVGPDPSRARALPARPARPDRPDVGGDIRCPGVGLPSAVRAVAGHHHRHPGSDSADRPDYRGRNRVHGRVCPGRPERGCRAGDCLSSSCARSRTSWSCRSSSGARCTCIRW